MNYPLFTSKRSISTCLLYLSISLFTGVLVSSFKTQRKEATATVKEEVVRQVRVLHEQAKQFTLSLELVSQEQISPDQAREEFYRLKHSYKQVEYLLEYLDPALAKSMNGAPIPKVMIEEADYQTLAFLPLSFRTFPPEGLQVIEELLFAEEVDQEMKEKSLVLAYSLEEKVLLFANSLNRQSLTDQQILESLREQMIRLMTMGITGFDAPAAGRELEFAAASLQPVLKAAQLYEHTENELANEQSRKASYLLNAAISYLEQHPDFETFDRLYFTRAFADPAYGAITALQKELLPETTSFARPVNQQAESLFSQDFLQAAYFAKQDREEQKPELIELGKILFFDPVLSANNERSCASCHNPAKAFTDGLPKSLAFDFKGNVQRNSPTLLNAVFSNGYFYDLRSQYLQDQVPLVLEKPDELHSTYEEVVEKLQHSKEYKKLFKKAFEGELENPLSVNAINRAIAAYVQNLVALDAPFDRYMRHETELLPESAMRGFNLFMGKAACGTCHFAPIFNGTVPPHFLESESEVLGVTASPDFAHAALDADSGRAGVIPADAWLHSFKTPTVRNIALTAPYMHNGAFPSLKEVVEFYNAGGGAGLGLEVPNQTLPPDSLELSEQEKDDLIAFMESLTDTTTTFSAPEHLPQFSSRYSELNDRLVGGKY